MLPALAFASPSWPPWLTLSLCLFKQLLQLPLVVFAPFHSLFFAPSGVFAPALLRDISTCRPLDPGVIRQSVVSHHASARSSSSDRHISLHELVLELVPHERLLRYHCGFLSPSSTSDMTVFVRLRDTPNCEVREGELSVQMWQLFSVLSQRECIAVWIYKDTETGNHTVFGWDVRMSQESTDKRTTPDHKFGPGGRCTHRAQEFSRVSSHSTHCLGFYTMHRDTDSVSTLIGKVSKLIHLQTVREILQSPGTFPDVQHSQQGSNHQASTSRDPLAPDSSAPCQTTHHCDSRFIFCAKDGTVSAETRHGRALQNCASTTQPCVVFAPLHGRAALAQLPRDLHNSDAAKARAAAAQDKTEYQRRRLLHAPTC